MHGVVHSLRIHLSIQRREDTASLGPAGAEALVPWYLYVRAPPVLLPLHLYSSIRMLMLSYSSHALRSPLFWLVSFLGLRLAIIGLRR
jgi:hypothetical protein